MNHLNNYFQKGTIIFVIVMLITIPNLHVCSSIGSYQTSSPAIMANKHFQSDHLPHEFSLSLGMAAALVAVAAVVVAIISSGVLAASVVVTSNKAQPPQLNYFDKAYAKYDFSGFDN